MTALKCYFTFAQEQFAAAAGREVAGSMALHALGKLHAALAQKKGTPIVAPESKAMVFYQAALLVYPKNYMAANDLGVLLAQCGNYADARAMLEHSLSLCRQSTSWQNLAVVYRQLGQTALAERAGQQAAHAPPGRDWRGGRRRRPRPTTSCSGSIRRRLPRPRRTRPTRPARRLPPADAGRDRRPRQPRHCRRGSPRRPTRHGAGRRMPRHGRRPRRPRPNGCRGDHRRINDKRYVQP